MIASMSRPGNPYDTPTAESFMRTLKRKRFNVTKYRDLEHLHSNLGEFIEQYYNVSGCLSAGYPLSGRVRASHGRAKRRTEPQGGKPGCCPPGRNLLPGCWGTGLKTPSPPQTPNPLLGRTEEIL